MMPNGRTLAVLALVVSGCAATKSEVPPAAIPPQVPSESRDAGVSDAGVPEAADAGPRAAAGAAAEAPQEASAPSAASEGESVIEATAAQGSEHGDEPAADLAIEDRTSEGLQSESLETRASGRPDHPRTLREIIASGYIRVLTRNNDTSFFIYRGHRMGFDYELGKKLAQRMGIRVDMVITNSWNEMVPALLRGEGDVIAAQVSVTEARKRQVFFANPWGQTHEVIVYREGAEPIDDLDDLPGKQVAVREGTTYVESLRALNARFAKEGKPAIQIILLPGDTETDTILEKLSKGELQYTVADENLTDIHVAFYENIVKGLAVSEERDLAWAVRPGDVKLRDQINGMLREVRRQPLFNVLKRKYFEATRNFKKERKDKFYASETGTLSQYDRLIQKHAEQHGFDWRLVAAQIYQESRFELKKKSWMGALGLFQIMPKTAKQLGIKDPHDPEQSIKGGLKYMRQLMAHYKDVPDDVERYRFAMAAYNSGFGHVDDARKLAREAGEDPLKWRTVANWLLRLSKREHYKKTRFGYCRGFEPVDYVRHIDERYAGYAQLVPLKKPQSAARY
jgi:membrane-bound lytic murein transglycosylase F